MANYRLPQVLIHLLALFHAVKGASTSSTPGAGSSGAASIQKPDWLEVSKDTIQEYMDIAAKRHKQAIATARENYNLAEAKQYPADENVLNSLNLKPLLVQSAGRLPDFHDQLDKKLFVTTPTPLFTPEECKECVEQAEAHFAANNDGKWTTLPSGQYDVAGFWINDIPAVKDVYQNVTSQIVPPVTTNLSRFRRFRRRLMRGQCLPVQVYTRNRTENRCSHRQWLFKFYYCPQRQR